MQQNTDLPMLVLLELTSNNSKERTVTGIARLLKTEKYKVSRSVAELEKEGFVDRSASRDIRLTEKGLEKAKQFQERVDVSMPHLLYEGMSVENAQHNAYVWSFRCTDEYLEIVRKGMERCRVKYELRNSPTFSGDELCRHIGDGKILLPFLFYRENVHNSSNILSMANEGFEHPCTLAVENGTGKILLRVKKMSAKSQINGQFLSGHVTNLKYFIAGEFTEARYDGESYTIPAEAVSFVNVGEGISQVFHGTVCIQMDCTVGVQHMPTSRAMFTILI